MHKASPENIRRAAHQINRCYSVAQKYYKEKLPKFELAFDLEGDMPVWMSSPPFFILRVNQKSLESNPEQVVYKDISRAVAQLFCWHLYGSEQFHYGPAWEEIHEIFDKHLLTSPPSDTPDFTAPLGAQAKQKGGFANAKKKPKLSLVR